MWKSFLSNVDINKISLLKYHGFWCSLAFFTTLLFCFSILYLTSLYSSQMVVAFSLVWKSTNSLQSKDNKLIGDKGLKPYTISNGEHLMTLWTTLLYANSINGRKSSKVLVFLSIRAIILLTTLVCPCHALPQMSLYMTKWRCDCLDILRESLCIIQAKHLVSRLNTTNKLKYEIWT